MSIDLEHLQEHVEGRAHKVGDTLATAVAELRDRTADALRADGGSVFRELARLGTRVDAASEDVGDRVTGRIDDVEAALIARLDARAADLDAELDRVRRAATRTSWPRRLFWLLLGVAAGAGLAYLLDPDRGEARRTELAATARIQVQQAAEQAVGAARQAASEAVEPTARQDAGRDVSADARQDVSSDPGSDTSRTGSPAAE